MFCIVFIFALFSLISTRSINKPLLPSHQLSNDKLQNSDDSDVFSTESSDDAAAGFFFRPRFGKRDTEEATAVSDESVSAGFFYRPKHGKRAAPQEYEPSTEGDDGAGGFFMKPKHGKRSAQRQIVMENIAALSPGFFMKPKVRRSVEEGTDSSDIHTTEGFFYRPREGLRSSQ